MSNGLRDSLRFKSCYHVEVTEPAMTFLLSEKNYHLLKGEIYGFLAPLLKEGIYNEDQLVEKLEGKISSAEIYYALTKLRNKGFIETVNVYNKELAAFCDILGTSVSQACKELEQKKVGIVNFSTLPGLSLEESLKIFKRDDDHSDVHLVVVDDYLDHRLVKWNLEAKHPWLLIKPVGVELWIGPFFSNDEKGCWECLAKRLRMNRVEMSHVMDKKGRDSFFSLSFGAIPSSIHAALHLASIELFKWVVLHGQSSLFKKLVTLDLSTSNLIEHPFLPIVNCSHCGTNPIQEFKPIRLEKRKKVSCDGGYRSVTPEQTLRKYEHLISPITGLVPKLSQIWGDETPVHVFHAGHNFALNNKKRGIHRNSFRETSAGKGRTKAQSKVGALCEAVERYSGLYQGDELKIKAYAGDLENVVDLKSLTHYSQKQYENRELWNQRCIKSHLVPKPYDGKEPIHWTPAWSLTHQRKVFLPTSFCFYGTDLEGYFFSNSNGCSSGNNLEEAIFQGLLELVERDAVAIWWYNQLHRPEVDLMSFCDPYYEELEKFYFEKDREIKVIEITHDIEIPVFVAYSKKLSGPEEILMGFGAHLNPKIALERALLEMNQMLVFPEYWKNMDSCDHEVLFHRKWMEEITVNDQRQFLPEGKKSAADYQYTEKSDLLEDLKECQKRIEDLGLEVIVLDQTRPDVGLTVVRVVVPDLRFFWPQFGPGRLYDVPVKMGWLSAPKCEEELNPIPVFI